MVACRILAGDLDSEFKVDGDWRRASGGALSTYCAWRGRGQAGSKKVGQKRFVWGLPQAPRTVGGVGSGLVVCQTSCGRDSKDGGVNVYNIRPPCALLPQQNGVEKGHALLMSTLLASRSACDLMSGPPACAPPPRGLIQQTVLPTTPRLNPLRGATH